MEPIIQRFRTYPLGIPEREVRYNELESTVREVPTRTFPKVKKIMRFQIKNCTDSQPGLKKEIYIWFNMIRKLKEIKSFYPRKLADYPQMHRNYTDS